MKKEARTHKLLKVLVVGGTMLGAGAAARTQSVAKGPAFNARAAQGTAIPKHTTWGAL